MEALDKFYSSSDPRNEQIDMEQESRINNKLLWDLVDSIEAKVKRSGIPIDWTDDSLDSVVIGNYEVKQGVFGSHDFKCLIVQPHSSEDMSKFANYFEEAEEVELFFDAHFNAFSSKLQAVK